MSIILDLYNVESTAEVAAKQLKLLFELLEICSFSHISTVFSVKISLSSTLIAYNYGV